MTELLPCPFCGGAGRFSRSLDGEVVNVRCAEWGKSCMGAGPNEYSEAIAAAGWNRRTSPLQTGEE
ncbi:Lar family restriction alleviation protein [Telmatospirillum sp. J64-1]|uniref:Lar family restriction alleviation protein n=1 Tax=Telmatospirillum sp. J64-1 TaxID=2502183 RepID=UPI00115E90A3